jgi:O-antigen ligase
LTGQQIHHAHNILLGVATEFGVVGLSLFLLMMGITVYRARKWRKMAIRLEEKRLAGMMLSLIFAFIGHGMYDYTIIAPQVGSLFILSVILINWQYERRCRVSVPSRPAKGERQESTAS